MKGAIGWMTAYRWSWLELVAFGSATALTMKIWWLASIAVVVAVLLAVAFVNAALRRLAGLPRR